MRDKNILDIILKNNQTLCTYNKLIVLKYFYKYIDFYNHNNTIFDKYCKYKNYSNLELCLFIIDKVTQIIVSIVNKTKIKFLEIKNSAIDDLIFSIQSVKLDFFVDGEFTDIILNGRIDERKLFETRENIYYNIKFSLIFKIKFFQILNKSKKNIDIFIKKKLFYTNGNVIYIKKKYVCSLKKLVIDYKLVETCSTYYKMVGDYNIYNFIDNFSYSSNIYLENSKSRLDLNNKRYSYLRCIWYKNDKLLKVLNYLNANEHSIDVQLYKNIRSAITCSKIYKDINNISIVEKKKIVLNTGAEIIFSDDSLYENIDIHRGEQSDFITNSLINEQLDNIITYNDNKFYLTHVVDRRFRIYIKQWPVNYQLNHFVRSIIEFREADYMKTYKKFFSGNLLYRRKSDHWKINKLTDVNCIKKFITAVGLNISIDDLYKNDCFLINDNIMKQSIILESLLTVLNQLPNKEIVNFTDRISWAVSNYNDINKMILVYSSSKIFDKDLLELIKNMHTIKSIVKLKLNSTYFADASSNALQLITLASGTSNIKLLQLLNIVENKTDFKDIYMYVLDCIKKIDFFKTLHIENDIVYKLVNRDVIKSIVMPLAYGKTKYANRIVCSEYWLNNNYDTWERLTTDEMGNICDAIWDSSIGILNDIGFDIEYHLKKCKARVTEHDILYNWLGLPIITTVNENIDRIEILGTIKKNKFILSNLIKLLGLKIEIADIAKYITSLNKLKPDISATQKKLIKIYKHNIRLNRKLETSDNDTRRITVNINGTIIQPRVKKFDSTSESILKKNNSISPNVTHSEDASILMHVILAAIDFGIEVLPIHDAIGTRLSDSSIVVYLYKETIIKYITDNINGKRTYPYGGEGYIFIENYVEEILNSISLFS